MFFAALRGIKYQFWHVLHVKNKRVSKMGRVLKITGSGLLILALSFYQAAIQAEEVTKAQVKGLDEQVQDIKSDVLGIATEINQLEEKLLYPSNSQVSFFISLEGKENFSIDSVQIRLDGKVVARHLYTAREVKALREGGVQRIYTGNVRTGGHQLSLDLLGQTSGSDYKKQAEYSFNKSAGPKFVEIAVGGPGTDNQGIHFKDW